MPSKSVILKVFTKELILNSVPGLKQMLRLKFAPKKMVEETGGISGFEPSIIHGPSAGLPPEFLPLRGAQIPTRPMAMEKIPSAQIPSEVAGINFGKLAPVILNPSVNVIECSGPDKNVIIRTFNLRKPYPIALSREEMQKIVEQFAKKAKVPMINGLMRAWIDKFMLSATVMNNKVENFIIQKVIYPHFA
jgi:hypothetical protein